MKFTKCAALMIAFLLIAGCDGRPTAPIDYPPDQVAFFEMNAECARRYEKGKNEVQKSLAFNDCNAERFEFSKAHKINGWIGELRGIRTDQGANYVSVRIRASIDRYDILFGSENNDLFEMGGSALIRRGDRLFNIIAELEEGDTVVFDGEFTRDDDRGIQELSLTEKGSVSDPVFVIKFSDIRPFDADVSGASAVGGGNVDDERAAGANDDLAERGEDGGDAARAAADAAVKAADAAAAAALDDDSPAAAARAAVAAVKAADAAATAARSFDDEANRGTEKAEETYGQAQEILEDERFRPDYTMGRGENHMTVAGDPAHCQDAMCFVQWSNQDDGRVVCIGIEMRPGKTEKQWPASMFMEPCSATIESYEQHMSDYNT